MFVDYREGGCLCRAVRYRIDVRDADISNCHCTDCRRQTGAPYLTFAVVPIGKFQWIKEPSGKIMISEKAIRYFCQSCGTYIRWLDRQEEDKAEINILTLDEPDEISIGYEIYTKSRLPWVKPIKGIPQFLERKHS